MRLLYLTAEQWPTFRADLTVLFGKYLPRHGISSDLLTEHALDKTEHSPWPAGNAQLCQVPKQRALQYFVKFLHQCRGLLTANYPYYDAIQVRDMTLIALVALVLCKLKRKPFFYWLSYPQSEGQIARAKARGWRAGVRYWFPLLQGKVGQLLLYRFILPSADHVFVQSNNMLDALANKGVQLNKMTAVPMGVDMEAITIAPLPTDDVRLIGKRVMIYLGTLDRTRHIELLFSMLAQVQVQIPNALLILAGDTEDAAHKAWLQDQAQALGVAEHIVWTHWLPMHEAWRYVVAAEVGLSPFPRDTLLDMASPTKAVEYMALGLPVVVNDNPDQQQVIQASGAGVCVALTAPAFAETVISLLNHPQQRVQMGQLGKAYIAQQRSYQQIAQQLADKYQQLLEH
ncbi:MAG TPA: glycosyltransferase [Methylophilus sp.]